MRPSRTTGFGAAGLIGLILALLLLPLARALVVERAYGGFVDCGTCVFWQSLGSDAWLAGAAMAILALALLRRGQLWRHLVAFAVFTLALVMLVDTLLVDLFNLRLYIGDVLKFGDERRVTLQFARDLVAGGYRPLPLLALLVPGIFMLLCFPLPGSARQARGLLVAATVMIVASVPMTLMAPDHVFREGTVNIVQLHEMRRVNEAYSETFQQHVMSATVEEGLTCEQGQGRHPDILLVVVESLSAHQSALLGGKGQLPKLDDIARRNTWFEAFHANGFTTDQGLIALLDGRVPVPAVGRYLSVNPFVGFGDPMHSVPGLLAGQGYETAFFTSGDLRFLDKVPWLRRMGLDHVEGSEHSFYDGKPRGIFDAVVDEILYERFVQWLDHERNRSKPFFAAVLTVETHPPFLDRETGRLDESALFHRADAALDGLYQALDRRGFFEHGILLVTGDHRSMTTVTAAEWKRYGDSALARVPLVVAGATGLPDGPITAAFQQVDLLPSLAHLTGQDEVCRESGRGSFLRPDPQSPEYILHARGDQRSRIDIYYPDGTAVLELAGDGSRVSGVHPERSMEIAMLVHRDRILRGKASENMASQLMEMAGRTRR